MEGDPSAMAFSPDGKVLASCWSDTTILLWDVPRARLAFLWTELPADILGQVRKEEVTPSQAIPLVKKWFQSMADRESRIGEIITRLDDDRFEVREQASRDLERMGPEIEPMLQRIRLETLPIEARSRIQNVLKMLKRPEEKSGKSPASVEALALAFLEEMANPEALEVLRELARGPAQAPVTKQAREALDRAARKGGGRKQP
jgi:hypothetical protein